MQLDLASLWAALNLALSSDVLLEPRQVLEGCEPLRAATWKSQLGLQDFSKGTGGSHWVYLTGNKTCHHPQLCSAFDIAVSEENQKRQKDRSVNLEYSPLSFIDCDVEIRLCFSWLLVPPALMLLSVPLTEAEPTASDVAARHQHDIVMRPIQLPADRLSQPLPIARLTPTQEITAILRGEVDVHSFEEWNGFLNPFTGTLGKRGGGMVWAEIKHHFGWLPVSQQTFIIGILVIVRFLIARSGPSRTQVSAADMVVPPGTLQ